MAALDGDPYLILHGGADPDNLPERSADLQYDAARSAGARVTLQYCDGAGHGQLPDTCTDEYGGWVVSFLEEAIAARSDESRPRAAPGFSSSRHCFGPSGTCGDADIAQSDIADAWGVVAVNTILELVDQAVAAHGDARALLIKPGFHTRAWSYRDIGEQVPRIASELRAAGVQPGDRVLIWSESRPEWCLAFLALLWAEAVAVPVDVRTADAFATRIAEQTGVRLVLASRATARAAARLELPVVTLELLVDRARRASALPRPEVDGEKLAEIVYTSGTTGDPKGVMLTHRNIASNAAATRMVVPLGPETRVLSILPLSHMYGLTPGFLAVLIAGACAIFPTSRQPAVLARTFREQRVTMLLAVPQVVKMLTTAILRQIDESGHRRLFDRLHVVARHLPMRVRRLLFRPVLSRLGGSLQYLAVGAAAMNPNTARWWEEMGVVSLQGYGATEASPVVAFTRIERNRIGTVGEVIPGVDVRVAADGELLVRGPNVFQGYWARPELTDAVLEDGWYHTGDHGSVDRDGFITLHGRKKDMIVMPDGTKVHPDDVEKALIADSRVRDAAVVGLEQPGGEVRVHAVLITGDASTADLEDIVSGANHRLGGHQQIRGWTRWPDEDFPRTATLKVRKDDLLRWLQEGNTDVAPVAEQPMSAAATSGAVARLVTQLDGVAPQAVRPDARLSSDLGLDSLARVELLSLIEEELGAYIDDGDLDPDETIAGLQARVDAGTGEQPEPERAAWALNPLAGLLRLAIQEVVARPLVAVLYRRSVRGAEHLDGLRGPVLFAPNHHLHNDNPIILVSIPLRWRWKLAVAAAIDGVFASRLRGWFATAIGNAFPLSRTGATRRSLDRLGARLDRGYSILIYPEGQLTVGGPLREFKSGTGLVAIEGGMPVVPVALRVLRYSRFDRGTRGTALRGEVEVAFGRPLRFGADTTPADATAEIQLAVAQLLGEPGGAPMRRGVAREPSALG